MAKKASSRKSAGSAGRKASAEGSAKVVKNKAQKARKAGGKSVKKSAAKLAGKPGKRNPKTAEKTVKSPLSKAELREIRNALLEKRRELLGDMGGIEAEALHKNRQEGSGDLSNMPTHPADVGTDNYEQEFTLGLLESERAMLEQIDAALERIDKGAFGVCLGTGKPIRKARLKARPWAKYSIEYARMLEKGLVKPDEDQAQAYAAMGDVTDSED